jgi:hypothetical protein
MTKKIIKALLFSLTILLVCSCKPYLEKELIFQELLPEKLDKRNIIQFDDYNVWCNNIIKGKDGKYHMIYSRWLKSRGFDAWVTHSEVAHAVSENLTGPYEFKNLALPPRGNTYWDGDMTHNPLDKRIKKRKK